MWSATPKLSYAGVEALLLDPLVANRSMGRAAHTNLGFRSIETVATVQEFADALRRRPRNLVFCECRESDTRVCDMIQSLRQDATAYNPFVVIIATAWERTSGLVSRVVNSGADDLLLRPFSAEQLDRHIEAQVERRKGFVVTSDYVGPDRRGSTHRELNVIPFHPPNSLKLGIMETAKLEAARQQFDVDLRAARDWLNAEKLRCDALQICVLFRLMEGNVADLAGRPAKLSKMAALVGAVERRVPSSQAESAGVLCQSLLAALDGLATRARGLDSISLPRQTALDLLHLFHPELSKAELFGRIEAIVALIRARRATTSTVQGLVSTSYDPGCSGRSSHTVR